MSNQLHSLLENYKAVIFDCDDTIIETAKTRWEALKVTAHKFHIALDNATIRASWGKPFDQLIADIVPELDFSTFVAVYQEELRNFLPVSAPGAIILLKMLQSRGLRLEIVTSSRRELIVQDLTELSLHTYFSGIWGYEETAPYHKPDPYILRPILAVLQSLGVEYSSIVYIGDSVRDYRVANGNSLDFIAVTTGLEDRSTFLCENLEPSRIIESLEELISYS